MGSRSEERSTHVETIQNFNISSRGNTDMGLTLTIISRGTVHDYIACMCGGLPSCDTVMDYLREYVCGGGLPLWYYVGGFLASSYRSFFCTSSSRSTW